MTVRACAIVLVAITVATAGCGLPPMHVRGGPQNLDVQVYKPQFVDTMRPLLQESKRAQEELDSVESKKALSLGFLLSGAIIGGVGCGVMAGGLNKPEDEKNTYLYSGLGVAGAGILIELVSMIFEPKDSDYANALTAYNAEFPATPWAAPELGVFANVRGVSTAPQVTPQLGLFGMQMSPSITQMTVPQEPAPAPPPEPVPAPKPPRTPQILAVFDIQDASHGFSEQGMDQLTEYLAASLAKGGAFRVVPRDQLRTRIVQEKTESYKQCFDQSCQIDLGKAVAAQKSLATKILRVGDNCAITATMFDLKTETTEKAASVRTTCSENSLMDGMDKIADQLAAD
jgi:hypothetical protein